MGDGTHTRTHAHTHVHTRTHTPPPPPDAVHAPLMQPPVELTASPAAGKRRTAHAYHTTAPRPCTSRPSYRHYQVPANRRRQTTGPRRGLAHLGTPPSQRRRPVRTALPKRGRASWPSVFQSSPRARHWRRRPNAHTGTESTTRRERKSERSSTSGLCRTKAFGCKLSASSRLPDQW